MRGMMKAVQFARFGGPEVLRLVEAPIPVVKRDEILIRTAAIGVNMVDTYWRQGLPGYRPEALPFTPGLEGGGVVAAVGPGVTGFELGDRVAAVMHPGSYAEYWAVPAAKVFPVPRDVGLDLAVAVALQGCTAHFLTHRTYPVKDGDWVLVHAAAGGVGGHLAAFASARGAVVIGTCSTAEKEARARACGCLHVIRYDREDFVAETRRLTAGAGVDVVYDSVGRATFERGLECLRSRGLMCLFGQSSGEVLPLDPQLLRAKGSLFLTRPSLTHYLTPRREFLADAGEVLDFFRHREVPMTWYAPEDVSEAHHCLEQRRTQGKLCFRFG